MKISLCIKVRLLENIFPAKEHNIPFSKIISFVLFMKSFHNLERSIFMRKIILKIDQILTFTKSNETFVIYFQLYLILTKFVTLISVLIDVLNENNAHLLKLF